MNDTAVIFLILGVLFSTLSILIWRFKYLNLLSGYDSSKVKDKNGLAKHFGQVILCISFLAFLLSIINYNYNTIDSNTMSFVSFVVISSILTLYAVIKAKKYNN